MLFFIIKGYNTIFELSTQKYVIQPTYNVYINKQGWSFWEGGGLGGGPPE